MAHEAKRGSPVCLPRRALLQRPKFATLLGLVASEWVSVEVGLSFLYATLLGKYLPHTHSETGASSTSNWDANISGPRKHSQAD